MVYWLQFSTLLIHVLCLFFLLVQFKFCKFPLYIHQSPDIFECENSLRIRFEAPFYIHTYIHIHIYVYFSMMIWILQQTVKPLEKFMENVNNVARVEHVFRLIASNERVKDTRFRFNFIYVSMQMESHLNFWQSNSFIWFDLLLFFRCLFVSFFSFLGFLLATIHVMWLDSFQWINKCGKHKCINLSLAHQLVMSFEKLTWNIHH